MKPSTWIIVFIASFGVLAGIGFAGWKSWQSYQRKQIVIAIESWEDPDELFTSPKDNEILTQLLIKIPFGQRLGRLGEFFHPLGSINYAFVHICVLPALSLLPCLCLINRTKFLFL